ncbi:YceI family protein [Pelagibacteraceae bacterium]|nr:YceI family protein [Pelagibacteraceae bacterium]
MKKLITWQGDILKKLKFILVFFYFLFQTSNIFASERWILDKSLSTIEFELPVLFAKNVKGQFNTIEGFVELDVENKENNKAIFSVQIDDLEMNYIKYKHLLLSNIFFDAIKFPLAVIDTKKFSYDNEKELKLDAELTLKGKSEMVPLAISITRLAEELVQIQTEMTFSRTAFNIGIEKWQNTSILKDKVKLQTNLFLFKE